MFSSLESGKQWNENWRGMNWGGKHQEAMFGKCISAIYGKKHKHLGPKVNLNCPFGSQRAMSARGTSLNLVAYVGLGIW